MIYTAFAQAPSTETNDLYLLESVQNCEEAKKFDKCQCRHLWRTSLNFDALKAHVWLSRRVDVGHWERSFRGRTNFQISYRTFRSLDSSDSMPHIYSSRGILAARRQQLSRHGNLTSTARVHGSASFTIHSITKQERITQRPLQ